MQDVGRSAAPRIALALACFALVGVFLVHETEEDQGFLESGARLHPKHSGTKAAVLPTLPKPLPVPRKPAVTEGAMVRCNACRKKLEDACEKAGGFPKCQRVPNVQKQFAVCQKQGITLSGNTLMCPGDKKAVPLKVQCNECRTRLSEMCNKYGGYPTCHLHKPVRAIAGRCTHSGLADIKGVLVCPGDAKISSAVACVACRFGVVAKCSQNGGFPQCLSNQQVHKAYVKCSRGGLTRLPETKALTCPGEDTTQLDSESAVCDACRDKLQGECSKWGGYPSCLKAAVVKATLKDCRTHRFLTLKEGRLFCKGDDIVKPHHMVAPKVHPAQKKPPHKKKPVHKKKHQKKQKPKQPLKKKSKKRVENKPKKVASAHKKKSVHKKVVPARKVVSTGSPKRTPNVKMNKKVKPHVPAKQVVTPPPGLTCEECRNHLTNTCKRLGGMAVCEHNLQYKQIFKKIRNSCMKFRGLIQHKDGSLGCPSDKVPAKVKHVKTKKAKLKKRKMAFPMMPPVPNTKTKKALKHHIAKQDKQKVASAQKAATVAHEVMKKHAKAKVAVVKKAKHHIAKQDKQKVASAQKAAIVAHEIMKKRAQAVAKKTNH